MLLRGSLLRAVEADRVAVGAVDAVGGAGVAGEACGRRGVRSGTSSSTACVAAAFATWATTTGSEVAAASSQPNYQALAEVGDITGGNNVPESSLGGETTCIVCMAHPKSHLAVPCGHQCACGACAGQMQACPYCRAPVQQWVQQRMV